jgi:hypothetical protein
MEARVPRRLPSCRAGPLAVFPGAAGTFPLVGTFLAPGTNSMDFFAGCGLPFEALGRRDGAALEDPRGDER